MCSIAFSLKPYRLWDDVEKYGNARQATGDNITQGMRFACRVTKATDVHLEYIILIAFPRQQWFCERTSRLLYSYISCLVNLDNRRWWLVSFSRFTLWEIVHNDYKTGRWVAEAIWRTEERKVSYSYWKSNREFSAVHLLLHSLLLRCVISRLLNKFVGFSEMGDCFRYDVNRDTFSRKRNVKMKTLVPETILTKKEDIIMKSLPKKKKWSDSKWQI